MSQEIKGFQLPGLDKVYTFPITPIDGSLSKEGEAADAAAAGKRLNNAEEQIKALNASMDELKNTATYSLKKQGSEITLMHGEEAVSKIQDADTTYDVVSTGANGLAPKLTGSTNQFLRGDGYWATPPDTTYELASEEKEGLMSTSDKQKLNALNPAALSTLQIESWSSDEIIYPDPKKKTTVTHEFPKAVQMVFVSILPVPSIGPNERDEIQGTISAMWTPSTSGTIDLMHGCIKNSSSTGKGFWPIKVSINDRTVSVERGLFNIGEADGRGVYVTITAIMA